VSRDDNTWREKLWLTHKAVNNGAQVFGDWLLTLRGGLCHTLADEKVKQKSKQGGEQFRLPTEEEKRDRRIVLALSWLSVESERGAPAERYVVARACGGKPGANNSVATVAALKEILESRGLNEAQIEPWVRDCRPTLSAAISSDAVWVNRSKTFDDIVPLAKRTVARDDCRKLLFHLFSDDYLVLPRRTKVRDQSEQNDEGSDITAEDAERRKDTLIKSGKGAGHKTRHPFSHLFGSSAYFTKQGKKTTLVLRDLWTAHLRPLVERVGIKFRSGDSCNREGSSATELQREMFSKAASRVAQLHTKIKQQEIDRANRGAADEKLASMERNPKYRVAVDLLVQYCTEQTQQTGSLDEYRIRPRAIVGWKEVVSAWSKLTPQTGQRAEEARRETAKTIAADQREEKFGDINLFIALATDSYKPVWNCNGSADPEILRIFVNGSTARYDVRRLKVDAYRHPDPLGHPVFCQYGDSRPHILFHRLRKNKLTDSTKDYRVVGLLVWDGDEGQRHPFLAVGSRFDREIGTIDSQGPKGGATTTEISRMTRHSEAAIALEQGKRVRVASVFDNLPIKPRKPTVVEKQPSKATGAVEYRKMKEPQWNGTLITEREVLDRLAVLAETNAEKAEAFARTRLNWWISVSLDLQPMGLWNSFAAARDLSPNPKLYPNNEANKGRGDRARLILSRLPGLRLLSVDLGHRYACACAVWEALSAEAFEDECRQAKMDGCDVTICDLYAFIDFPEREARRKKKGTPLSGKGKKFRPRKIYRRIGPDHLDGSVYPAPWARLDRQFTIELQGEDESARKPAQSEIEMVEAMAREFGKASSRCRVPPVDELMSDAVRTAELALRRHGLRAKIAYNLKTDKIWVAGTEKELRPQEQTEWLTKQLADWYSVAHGKLWTDDSAKRLWDTLIAPMLGGVSLPVPEEEECRTSQEKRSYQAELQAKLSAVANALGAAERATLHDKWSEIWHEEDKKWPRYLGTLKKWILPSAHGNDGPEIRHVGGLSLMRIATVQSLYRLHRAYAGRPEPDDPRKHITTRGESGAPVGREMLKAMEQMRENRVKQLASRIVEAALGIGIEQSCHGKKSQPRPRQQINAERFAPCHAIVIENLTHYKPEETRTRRENRGLMRWSASKVKKYLQEACELHSIHLRTVAAAYTSKQDSRTGAPGIRCKDFAVAEFVKQSGFLWPRIKAARGKDVKKRRAIDQFLVDLYARWDLAQSIWTDADNVRWQLDANGHWNRLDCKDNGGDSPQPVRIPVRGGEVFVSASGAPTAAAGLQADLNAAANIGVKALLDPDWEGRWWYVPCFKGSLEPVKDHTKGCRVLQEKVALKIHVASEPDAGSQGRNAAKKPGRQAKSEEIVNLWSHPSTSPLQAADGGRNWMIYPEYWNKVEERVIRKLRRLHGLDRKK